MGHYLNAVIIQEDLNSERSQFYEMKVEKLGVNDLYLFILNSDYLDYWERKLNVFGSYSESPMYNLKIVHDIVVDSLNSKEQFYAIIDVDYFGSVGRQAAAVYQNKKEIMKPESTEILKPNRTFIPINKALKILGVKKGWIFDEFDKAGLYAYDEKDYEDYFEKYEDE